MACNTISTVKSDTAKWDIARVNDVLRAMRESKELDYDVQATFTKEGLRMSSYRGYEQKMKEVEELIYKRHTEAVLRDATKLYGFNFQSAYNVQSKKLTFTIGKKKAVKVQAFSM